jgi:hypothetical protein
VLAALHVGPVTGRRLAPEDDVRRLVTERSGGPLCPDQVDHPACNDLTTVYPEGTFLELGHRSKYFRVEARARYGSVRRTLEVILDRNSLEDPHILAWRVR